VVGGLGVGVWEVGGVVEGLRGWVGGGGGRLRCRGFDLLGDVWKDMFAES
jgi:hypothetical protein